MFKSVMNDVWAFDTEWVPDPASGRALYGLPADMPDREVVEQMWQRNGATEDDPRPFLKLSMCRVVSVAVVMRHKRGDGAVALDLRSMPSKPKDPETCKEGRIIWQFLKGIGRRRPQLVGFNSQGADLPILIQRAIINGISVPEFCKRPSKPWEGADYFAKGSDWNVDLMLAAGAWGKAQPSLEEMAVLSGVPGKLDGFDGSRVAEAWLDGDVERIVHYNEHDALTTYLVWLRYARFAGFVNEEQYGEEQGQLRSLVEKRAESPNGKHLAAFLERWDQLEALASSS